jgi:hypothetical protein
MSWRRRRRGVRSGSSNQMKHSNNFIFISVERLCARTPPIRNCVIIPNNFMTERKQFNVFKHPHMYLSRLSFSQTKCASPRISWQFFFPAFTPSLIPPPSSLIMPTFYNIQRTQGGPRNTTEPCCTDSTHIALCPVNPGPVDGETPTWEVGSCPGTCCPPGESCNCFDDCCTTYNVC